VQGGKIEKKNREGIHGPGGGAKRVKGVRLEISGKATVGERGVMEQ